MRYRKLQRTAFFIFLGLIIGSLAFYYVWGASFQLDEIRGFLHNYNVWAPLVFIVIYILGTILIPSTPFMALAGILFGFKEGVLYTVIGGLLSSLLVFGISRKLGKEIIDETLKKRHLNLLVKYDKRLERGGIWDLAILRMIPIMPFNVLNLIMGVSKIKTKDYLFGTLLGLIPSIILTVYFGHLLFAMF